MFDKLIESNSVQADFKPRRKFFMVSSVVVGILFITAVVASLYAQELNLGTNTFEIVEMIAPVPADAPEPEPPRQQPRQQTDQQETSELPVRRELIETLDQPTKVPNEISTTRFTGVTIPSGQFVYDPNGQNSDGSGNPTGSSSADSISNTEPVPVEVVKPPEPPPVARVVPKRPQTKGVVNGDAIELPKPSYPPPARAINLTGVVNVQVLIDETGNVVSAKAIDGHPFFKPEAVRSAKLARFRPTLLSGEPVKVTGVIVYRFTR